MTITVFIDLIVNGEDVRRTVEPRETLVDFLRQGLQLTGTHTGCEMGVCGACLVLVDDKPTHACLMFAVQAAGAIADLQKAFHERNALQCGFCTPGMLVTAYWLLNGPDVPTREEIRDALSGNYCRCTGYEAIVDAIEKVAWQRARNKAEAKLVGEQA
jgi:aerobic carbon-monoxide dehydrogenase small subunit